MSNKRRWYDKDESLQEAMELLKLSSDDHQASAAEYLSKLQEEVAKDVIEKVYNSVKTFSKKGTRWYDKDPVVLRAVELLREAPPEVQKKAARKLILSLQTNDMNIFNTQEEDIEQ